MAEGKVYRLEMYTEEGWKTYGIYPEKFINQLANAVCDLYRQGYRPYETMRIQEAK